MSEAIIDIRNACAYRQDLLALDHLSLQVRAGEAVAVLGPNGAGKSSLLKLITRELYPKVMPDSYVRLYGSETVNLWQLRQKIGLVSNDLQIDYTPYTTGLEVVLSGFFGAVGQHDHLQATEQQLQRAERVIAQLGLEGLQQRMYQRMSTGQQRRFLLARAMVHDPQLYIFDEPSSGLDIAAAHQLLGYTREVCQAGKAVLLATHHVEEIVPEISRVVLIREGRVVADGNKAEVLQSEVLSELYGIPLKLIQEEGWYRLAHCS